MSLRILCVALLLPVAGCGTAANQVRMQHNGGAALFGGVHHDIQALHEATEPGPMRLHAVDLPFSLIGDLLLLPYTATFTYVNHPSPSEMQAYSTTEVPMLPPPPPQPAPLSMPKNGMPIAPGK